jgi:hypothetical protein
MAAMSAAPRPCRLPFALSVGTVALMLVACGSAPSVPPAGSPSAVTALASPASASSGQGSSAIGSAALSPSASPAAGPSDPGVPASQPASPGVAASVRPFTPPPEMAALDDDACLAVLTRAQVETALGGPAGSITAQGTDPNTGLTCSYAAGSGDSQLLVTTETGDPQAAFDADRALAEAYGQQLTDLSGIGDRAFHGSAAAEAPEQVVFTKGPVIVRLWNQTSATIGRAAFAKLATAAANAIHAEIPPAP